MTSKVIYSKGRVGTPSMLLEWHRVVKERTIHLLLFRK
jgi:hypothetical protein